MCRKYGWFLAACVASEYYVFYRYIIEIYILCLAYACTHMHDIYAVRCPPSVTASSIYSHPSSCKYVYECPLCIHVHAFILYAEVILFYYMLK